MPRSSLQSNIILIIAIYVARTLYSDVYLAFSCLEGGFVPLHYHVHSSVIGITKNVHKSFISLLLLLNHNVNLYKLLDSIKVLVLYLPLWVLGMNFCVSICASSDCPIALVFCVMIVNNFDIIMFLTVLLYTYSYNDGF